MTLVNVGKLTKPATKLIEKVSDAVGGIARPWQVVRVAKAEAAAKIIEAEGDIEIANRKKRAVERWINELTREQNNIETITAKSIPLLSAEAAPEKLSDDWLANFFKACRTISDAEVQELWAKILAGEANRPGTVSRHTINVVAQLEKEDAEVFARLAQRLCQIGPEKGILRKLLYGQLPDSPYQPEALPKRPLLLLQSVGMISYTGQETVSPLETQVDVRYFDNMLTIDRPPGGIFFDRWHFEIPGEELFAVGLFKPNYTIWAGLVDIFERIKKKSADGFRPIAIP